MELMKKRWLRLPTQKTSMPRMIDMDINHTVKIANSPDELFQAFQILYREYRRCGYTLPHKRSFLFTMHHLLPETTVFIAKKNTSILSTATVIYDSQLFGLPMDELYSRELQPLRDQNRKILEISSLASDPSANNNQQFPLKLKI